MALKSGRSAGLEVRESVFENVSKYLDSAASFDGAGYGYQPRKAPSPAMTAEGLLCRQYLGWSRDEVPLRNGIEALLLDAPFTLSDRDVYYWYYATQVLHHYGAEPWQQWNNTMRVDLPNAQVKSGREDGGAATRPMGSELRPTLHHMPVHLLFRSLLPAHASLSGESGGGVKRID